jgi:outer membrane protein
MSVDPLHFIKRNLLYLAICALCLFSGARPALAEVAPALDMEQAIILALAHNQDLLIAADQVHDGEISTRLQRDQFLPAISADGSATVRHDAGAVDGDRNYDSLAADITLRLNLFNGFGDQAALEAARQTLAARKHSYSREEQQLVFTTIGNYLEAVRTLEQIQVAEQDLRDNELQLADIEAYYRAGRRPITDVYLQKAETARARSALLSARRDYLVSKLTLLQTIGIDATATVEVVMPDHSLLKTVPETDAAALVATALVRRPDLQASQKEVAAAGEQIRVAKSGAYPVLDLAASTGTSYDGRNDEHFGSQMREDNFNASLGLSLSVPLFDRNLSRHQVSQALIGSNTARLGVRKLQRQIEVEIGQAVADYRTADEQLEVARAQLTYAANAVESTEKRYQVGAATLTELTSARSVYIEARYALIEAEIDRMVQTVAIAFYSGDLDTTLFSQPKEHS